jgi:hypothetical protein
MTYSSSHLGLLAVTILPEFNCRLTWMFVLECGQIIDVLVYDDVQAWSGGNIGGRESLRHFG